jgi:lactose/L-arabinose transport system ATP-binding protein
MTLADKIVVLRKGKIEQVGSPMDLYEDPANAFVAGFIGSPKMNFFKASLGGGAISFGGTSAPAPFVSTSTGAPMTVGIRPEHFDREGPPDVALDVAVEFVEHLGGTSYVHGHLASNEPIVVERRSPGELKPGQTVKAGLRFADTRYFGEDGARLR